MIKNNKANKAIEVKSTIVYNEENHIPLIDGLIKNHNTDMSDKEFSNSSLGVEILLSLSNSYGISKNVIVVYSKEYNYSFLAYKKDKDILDMQRDLNIIYTTMKDRNIVIS